MKFILEFIINNGKCDIDKEFIVREREIFKRIGGKLIKRKRKR